VLMFGAHISVPYFTPYMLRTLKMSMLEFAAITVSAIFAKVVSFPVWGRLAPRIGMQTVFLISVGIIATLPLQWALCTWLPGLFAIELLSGCGWAGFEYASLQLLMRDAPRQADVEFFSLAGTLSGSLQLGGSLVGSHLLEISGSDYHLVFLVSSAGRALAMLLLLPMLASLVMQVRGRHFSTMIMSVREGAGAFLRHIGMGEERPPANGNDRPG